MNRLLYNASIQPHFDYVRASSFPFLNKNSKHRLQTAQNKHIRLCLDLSPHSHIDATHVRKIYWFPVSERVESCITATAFKHWSGVLLSYVMACFRLHSIGKILDHKWHWIDLCKKET